MITKCHIAVRAFLGGHQFSLNGERVSREQFLDAARTDPSVHETLVRFALHEVFGLRLDEYSGLFGDP